MLDHLAVTALNHVVSQAPWASAKLKPYAGREALLVMNPWRMQMAITEDGQFALARGVPEVEITLPMDAPILALQGQDKAMRAAQIKGSVELADTLGFVLRHLTWDFEEDLSRLIGDIPAHRVAGAMRVLAAWQKEAAHNMAENMAEYLRDETGTIPSPREIEAFSGEVDQLRDDLARLEKRLQILRA